MNDQLVGLGELGEAIANQIRELSTVDSCFEYNGQFDSKDFNLVSSNAEWGTTCFVTLTNGKGDAPKRHILNNVVNVKIFVMGLQDLDEEETKQGVSSMCLNSVEEIQAFVNNNNFGFALPLVTRPADWDIMNLTQDEEQRVRIAGYIIDFQVTIKNKYTNAWQI